MTIFTDSINRNSFLGLVTNGVRIAPPKRSRKIEAAALLANFAIFSALIVATIAAGTVTQHRIETARYTAEVQSPRNA